jgi:hypothetical protein
MSLQTGKTLTGWQNALSFVVHCLGDNANRRQELLQKGWFQTGLNSAGPQRSKKPAMELPPFEQPHQQQPHQQQQQMTEVSPSPSPTPLQQPKLKRLSQSIAKCQ